MVFGTVFALKIGMNTKVDITLRLTFLIYFLGTFFIIIPLIAQPEMDFHQRLHSLIHSKDNNIQKTVEEINILSQYVRCHLEFESNSSTIIPLTDVQAYVDFHLEMAIKNDQKQLRRAAVAALCVLNFEWRKKVAIFILNVLSDINQQKNHRENAARILMFPLINPRDNSLLRRQIFNTLLLILSNEADPFRWHAYGMIEHMAYVFNEEDLNQLSLVLRNKFISSDIKFTDEEFREKLCRLVQAKLPMEIEPFTKKGYSAEFFALQNLKVLFFSNAAYSCASAQLVWPSFLKDSSQFNQLKLNAHEILRHNPFSHNGGRSIYGFQFYISILKNMLKVSGGIIDDNDRNQLKEELELFSKNLLFRIERATLSQEDYDLFDMNTYSLATSLLSIHSTIGLERISALPNPQNPLKVNYYLHNRENYYESWPNRERHSRAVVVHLAIYVNEDDPAKKAFAKHNLKQALNNYLFHMPALLASYFKPYDFGDSIPERSLYAILPYAASAINIMLSNSSESEKNEIQKIAENLKKSLAMLFEEGTFFKKPVTDERNVNEVYDPEGAAIDYLFGLALITLIDPKNTGIISL